MKVIVDADACPRPVLEICKKLAQEHSIPLWTVANFNHSIVSDNHVIVGNSSQESDIKIINLAQSGDVGVTQDWGLAAMLLGKGVRCINPAGWEYHSNSIEFLLEEREAKAKYRRSGGRTKGPKKRTNAENFRFEMSLKEILSK